MFYLNHKQINPAMSKYINDKTNKWIEQLKLYYSKNQLYTGVSDLVKYTNGSPNLPNGVFIIPFVSLISFLVGYNCVNLFRK